MAFHSIVLNIPGREEALEQIKRFEHELFPVMFYRTNDLVHARRVLYHLEHALPLIMACYKGRFDMGFARTLALVHDDVEILTGDVQLHDKERMSQEEKEALAMQESQAIPHMITLYGSEANSHDYETLLRAAKAKDRLEAQFVSFFDKFDGAGEAWHEVCAGNEPFVLPAGGKDGRTGGYVRRLNEFPTLYPQTAVFFCDYPDFLPEPFDFAAVAKQGTPHTKESLQKNSGYPPYERWKRTIMDREGLELLVRRVE